MRLLRYQGSDAPVQVRAIGGAELDRWREKVVGHLNSTDREDHGRYRYETIQAASPDIEPVTAEEYLNRDTAVLAKPARQKPEEPRVVVDEMTRSVVQQWLLWRRTDPDLFWRKITEAKLIGGLGHLTDEQAADQIVALCRKVEEAAAQATYKKRKIGGGWKGAVLTSGDPT